jgi:alkylation response protein AidB-like acyl-CoA dehydrogenase
LRDSGVLRAPLPRRYGGFGFGTEPTGAMPLFRLLRRLGAANLAAGRFFEGHVNAVQLICRYGDESQMAACARDLRDGHLFAIWNTEAPPGVRRAANGRLTGGKRHVSAAGIATRAVITVDQHRSGDMLVVRLAPGERAAPMPGRLHGMRASASGCVDFTGYAPEAADWIGQGGDYLAEPVFSAGAWRTLAVLLGGIEALVGELRGQLHARGRAADPHQRGRIAEALIAQETAALWVGKAAILAEAGDAAPESVTGYVNLARKVVETAGLGAMQLAQRSLGLMALVEGNPVEALLRDLATYLRQPAMDEALGEAAAHFTVFPLPEMPPR